MEREEHEFKLRSANEDVGAKIVRKRQRKQVEKRVTLTTPIDVKDILGGLLAGEDDDWLDAASDVAQQYIEVPCVRSTYLEAVE